jgi:hypothetical protein
MRKTGESRAGAWAGWVAEMHPTNIQKYAAGGGCNQQVV